MTWTQSDIPNLAGRIAVVTGANGGLGLETAKALAGAGAHVVMAVRNQAKAAEAVSEIRAIHPAASLELVSLDLADQSTITAAAETILAKHQKIDLLINNAGLMAMPERKTVDGYEMQFGVNHLGHWTLTALLMEAVVRADAARVVTVTSTAHHIGRRVDPENPHLHGRYGAWKAYGQAKLANFHFGIGLQREFAAKGLRAQSLVAHPGLTNSDLQSTTVSEGGGGFLAPFFHTMAKYSGMSVENGARSQLRAATDPAAKGGEFYGPLFVNNGPAIRKPILRRWGLDASIAALWSVSERETGVKLIVGN